MHAIFGDFFCSENCLDQIAYNECGIHDVYSCDVEETAGQEKNDKAQRIESNRLPFCLDLFYVL